MFGQATLSVPANRTISGPTTMEGLSDELAMSYGRIFAMTLSDSTEFVTVTLESGSVRVIGHDTILNKLTIGRLHPNYRTHAQRGL